MGGNWIAIGSEISGANTTVSAKGGSGSNTTTTIKMMEQLVGTLRILQSQ